MAVSLVRRIFDRLDDKTAMLIGAGRMGELTARSLKRLGIGTLLITNPTFERAVGLARELGGTPIPYANFKPHLKMADVIIGSLTATQPVLGPDDFASVLAKRRHRSTFLIDLGVPRNFDERLNSVENIYLYDIDDLGRVAVESLQERRREVVKAEQIIEFEVNSFMRWLAELDLVPAIKDIRYSIEQLRAGELRRHRAWLTGLAPDERERIEFLTRSLTNKLLHRVLAGLRDSYDGTPEGVHTAVTARRLLCADLPM
jgi:glutamyl-tRNA reductase